MSNILVLDQLSNSSATTPQPRKRLGAQKTLAFATATAAFFAVAGTAQAQAQDCMNGYRMVRDEIAVACSTRHFGRALDTRLARAQAHYRGQVLYTQFGCFAYDGRRVGEVVRCNY